MASCGIPGWHRWGLISGRSLAVRGSLRWIFFTRYFQTPWTIAAEKWLNTLSGPWERRAAMNQPSRVSARCPTA